MSQDIACRLYAAHDLRIEHLAEPQLQQGAALVRVLRGGICGSDLHYYHDGGFGPVRVRAPIVLGHEAVGVIEAAPEDSGLKSGQLVSLSPSRPCGECEFCLTKHERHCLSMRFNGSAMGFPHEDGFFRSRLYHPIAQCIPLSDGASTEAAAGAEPLAVCLHALNMAPSLKGKRILVTGAGPIGIISTALARLWGAAEIVVTDVQDFTLKIAGQTGADRVVNVTENPDSLSDYAIGKGRFDIVFECSANPHAIAQAISVTRPQGTIVQVGVGGMTPLPLNLIVSKELRFIGTQRFDQEFADAVRMIDAGEIDLSPMVTHVLDAKDARRAFDLAGDRKQAVKVQLSFEG